jgi:diguanylate cyclase (GGDEF)-like protein
VKLARLAWLARLRESEWLPTAVVLAVVLAAGSRLIYLNVERHAEAARVAANALARTYVHKIEPEFQRLASVAVAQAAAAAKLPPSADLAASLESLPLAANTFWMSAADQVLRSPPADNATAVGVASEWRAAESLRPLAGVSFLGPLRLGSEWLAAVRAPAVVRAPVPVRGASAAAPLAAWAVAVFNLDELIFAVHLERLVNQGYDFELAQLDPRSGRSRVFLTSSAEALMDAARVKIGLPEGVAAAVLGSDLEVRIRPRAGWYPSTQLAADIGLLAFLAWLLAFGAHDMGHALRRSRAALSASRRRVQSINQQLTEEMRQRSNLQETIDHARFHDAFTGLPNRRYFMDQVDRALRDVRTKRRRRIAVVIVDISRFKLVNEMLGHTAGDELMVQAARRFGGSTASFEGVLARWSGDQFAVLLLDVESAEAAVRVAGILQADLRLPFELRRHRLVVTATAGVTVVDSGQQRAEDVVREADIALSVAKRKDSAKIVVYKATMAGQAASLVSLEADLHIAMDKRELQLLFQPIVDLRTYQMVGAEALLRWRHPVESLLAPDKFMGIAEEAGLMVPITRWVIARVVRLAGDWRRRLPANQSFFISVNVSPTALRDPGLPEHVATLLREADLPPSLLKIELTEAALISDAGAARETLDRLHSMGVQLMLDDFGTGYSSLSYLQLFPFDYVKLDRPFVNRTGTDQANSGMMAALVQMAASLKLTAIAEVIETEAAARALQAMGCAYAQGFYFSEPIEAELALHRLRTQHPFKPADTSATVSVPALKLEGSREEDRAAEEDGSPTIMLPEASIGFASGGEAS